MDSNVETSESATYENPSFPLRNEEENLSKVSKKRKSNSSHGDEDEVVAKQRKEIISEPTSSTYPTIELDNSELLEASSEIYEAAADDDDIHNFEMFVTDSPVRDPDIEATLDVETEDGFHDSTAEVKKNFRFFF